MTTIALEKMTKTEFNKLHGANSLGLVTAKLMPKEDVVDLIQKELDKGTDLHEYARLTSRVDTAGTGTQVYYDAVNNIIIVETLAVDGEWERWSSHRPQPQTVVYIVK